MTGPVNRVQREPVTAADAEVLEVMGPAAWRVIDLAVALELVQRIARGAWTRVANSTITP